MGLSVFSPGAPPPVIGISGANSDSASVRAMMTQLRDAGAIPLFLGNHAARDPQADLAKIDALVVMGNNGDIDPAYYGEAAHSKTAVETDKSREAYEFAMLRAAIEQKMPVLGVCGGMQRINVLLGGSLHQHVPDMLGGNNYHAQQDSGVPPFCPVQAVQLEPGSTLAALAQGIRSVYTPAHEGMIAENSMHHQAVNALGTGLRVAARSIDGIIEAIEADPHAKQVVLGVQWHPEFGASELGPRIAASMAGAAQTYAQANGRAHPLYEAVEESMKSSLPAIQTALQKHAAAGRAA